MRFNATELYLLKLSFGTATGGCASSSLAEKHIVKALLADKIPFMSLSFTQTAFFFIPVNRLKSVL